jgi:uncharacterized protein YqeY
VPKRSEVAVLRQTINESVKTAMKAQDKARVSTLRLINAAIQSAEIELERSGKTVGDDEVIGILQKMVKQRQESIEIFDANGRKELADKERAEIDVIREYMPQQMSEAEAKAAIAEVIAEIGAQGIKDMGKVMNALKTAYAGKMDFGKVSGLVKGLLTGG